MDLPQPDTIDRQLSQPAFEDGEQQNLYARKANLHPHEAITLRNREESALLRLPPEIRNEIWAYVCGDYLIAPTSVAFPYSLYTSRLWGPNKPWVSGWTGRQNPTVICNVSRQLHLETSKLFFELNDFKLSSLRGLNHFIDALTEKQRNAIRTMRISLNVMGRIARKLWQFWNQVDHKAPLPQNLDDRYLAPFQKLPGLKRVVVDVAAVQGRVGANWIDHVPRRACEGMIRQLGGNAALEIVYNKREELKAVDELCGSDSRA